MSPTKPRSRPVPATAEAPFADLVSQYDRVALLLQGGGALGSYHVGVWEALAAAAIEPTWISGVSIGAINAAIIAGSEPSKRLEHLHTFWDRITGKGVLANLPGLDLFRPFQAQWAGWTAMTMGQPGFFSPRIPSPWLLPRGMPGATSLYHTSELEATLTPLINFDRINDGPMRFSVGAVEVESGNFEWFDSHDPEKKTKIDMRHIMASGALPPALPAIEIDGKHYWDGGIVSNTPLEHLLDQKEDLSSLVIQVDLFPAQGPLPQSMSEVQARQKDITYSSRTRAGTTRFKQTFALRRRLLDALARIPEDQRTDDDEKTIHDLCRPGVVNILHVIYRTKHWERDNKDYEFSARTAAEHRDTGLADMQATLAKRAWFALPTTEDGVKTWDIHDPK